MDKIWDRKSFEVGGHWSLWRGWKKRMTTQNRQKSNAKKIKNKKTTIQMLIPDNYKFTYSDYSNACIHTYRDY